MQGSASVVRAMEYCAHQLTGNGQGDVENGIVFNPGTHTASLRPTV